MLLHFLIEELDQAIHMMHQEEIHAMYEGVSEEDGSSTDLTMLMLLTDALRPHKDVQIDEDDLLAYLSEHIACFDKKLINYALTKLHHHREKAIIQYNNENHVNRILQEFVKQGDTFLTR